MSRRLLIGTFANEHDLLAVTAAARERGYPIVDAYAPYPVHGLDKAMGLKSSRLSVFCFLMGLAGVGLAMLLQHWTMAIDWPINVGGRPFNSWPAYVPVAFEVLVLLAGFGVVFAFFGVSRLYPGKASNLVGEDATNDRFVLVIEAREAATDTDAVLCLYREHDAVAAVERDEAPPNTSASWCNAKFVNGVLGSLLILTIVLHWSLGTDHSVPNREFLPEMVRAVPYESFGKHPDLPNQIVLQAPIEGTKARGQKPMPYDRQVKRGTEVFANYCQVCHGPTGEGGGPASQRGVPPPPSFFEKKIKDGKIVAEKGLKLTDSQIFQVITHGKGNMAAHAGQVSPEDRRAVILHLHSLEKAGGIAP